MSFHLILVFVALLVPLRDGWSQSVPVKITAAIVEGLDVRKIPRLEIAVLTNDSVVLSLRTSLGGEAQLLLNEGSYRIETPVGVAVNGVRYSWKIPFVVKRDSREIVLELVSDNAVVSRESSAGQPALPAAAPEQSVFRRIRSGVLRVESGMGHGTGFLVDVIDGAIVTNDHVVANETLVSVYVDSATRVVAQVVARDRASDLAVLRLPRSRCESCARLSLAGLESGRVPVEAGDRVLAIGFPLNQGITLTSGIVAGVRPGAIASDVNINPGNSGGPLVNLGGNVVGVNTFADEASVGPGVAGSVSVALLLPLLDAARAKLDSLPPLEDRLLPARPTIGYPLAAVRSISDTASYGAYRHVLSRMAGNFEVRITTPVITMTQRRRWGDVVGAERRQREIGAGIGADERYAATKDARDWQQYAGHELLPLVQFSIDPMIGESFWSAFGRGLEQSQYGVSLSQAKLRVRGDVRGARFYRNGVEVQPIFGGHSPVEHYQNDRWAELRDVADRGYFLLPPELFAPDELGRPALVTVVVQDLKSPGTLSAVDYHGETSARMWRDFAPFFEAKGTPPRIVDERLSSPSIPLLCSSRTGVCTPR